MPNRNLEAALAAFAPARRGACPSREDLVACFDRSLSPDVLAAIRTHTAVCAFCASDLADLTALATPPLLEAVVQVLGEGLRLVSHTFGASAALQPQPARGGAAAQAVDLTASDDAVELHVRLHTGSVGAPDLRVQVNAPAAAGERVRVSLYRGDALLESRLCQGTDEVLFTSLEPGGYQITLSPRSGDEVARVALTLQAGS